jgi:hypothetical protein
VERRPLSAPEGYHGELIAGVKLGEARPNEARLGGYVLAWGATVGRCYAAVFTTQASGTDAELRIGRTLAVAAGVLDRVRAASVDDRAPHPEFPF